MPKLIRKPTALAAEKPLEANRSRSIIGLVAVRSRSRKSARKTTPATSEATIWGLDQPALLPRTSP